MILLLAIIAGIVAALARAWYTGSDIDVPDLRWLWLVPIAFVPQGLAFYAPGISATIADTVAAAGLISSQMLLLAFVWANRHARGIALLGLGLALNLLVIALNGGLMPISPETVQTLAPAAPPDAWHIGERLGTTKDIVLEQSATRLWWLSDWLTLPRFIPYRVAFSLGDVLIAAGAFWLLWGMGERNTRGDTITYETESPSETASQWRQT